MTIQSFFVFLLWFHVCRCQTNCNAGGEKRQKTNLRNSRCRATLSPLFSGVTSRACLEFKPLIAESFGDMYHLEALAHAECFRLTMDCCWAPNMLIEGAAVSSIEHCLCFRRWSQTSAILTEVLFIHQTRHAAAAANASDGVISEAAAELKAFRIKKTCT